MKKNITFILSLMVLSLISFGFISNEKYPDYVSKENVEIFESEYLKTINNETLNNNLEKYFVSLFDKVNSVNAQFSKKIGYYYIVFGEKNKGQVIQLLKIEKADIENETYTYIDFSKVDLYENIEICYTGELCECTINPCCVSCNVVCGLWDGFNCSP